MFAAAQAAKKHHCLNIAKLCVFAAAQAAKKQSKLNTFS